MDIQTNIHSYSKLVFNICFPVLRQPAKTIYNQASCIGTDLNRNWGYRFDDKEGYDADDDYNTVGQTDCACDTIYHGGRAFSAPETRNVKRFIEKQSQIKFTSQQSHRKESKIKFFNSLHAFGQLVVIPWGFTEDPPPHIEELRAFATKVSSRFSLSSALLIASTLSLF